MNNLNYWYARGYFDGRTHGNQESLSDDIALSDQERRAYTQGYDTGVTDYCDMDVAGDAQ